MIAACAFRADRQKAGQFRPARQSRFHSDSDRPGQSRFKFRRTNSATNYTVLAHADDNDFRDDDGDLHYLIIKIRDDGATCESK